ncbi:hypothetical protein PP940_gp025 [Rhizobium phage RL2RES]|uniref:Uncharacterized protein n=1 Tax=Rhizobium phage RL2RES TaxID=103371 RepID=A0A6B9J232_9CAUD|nr:hypothetical protein PP940_gp025 [Rhizobium phage RL2RES]QGZ14300.1 hypothetical protein RL2RES_025 [Rhizobium phage RL2RES]
MRIFEFDVINVKKLARNLIDYEFNFEVDFERNVVRIHITAATPELQASAINQMYTFLIDHYDPLITLSDVTDSEIFPVDK